MGWVREVVLHSYPGAKVSWCTLETKNKGIDHQNSHYLFTFPIEHILCALCFTYMV